MKECSEFIVEAMKHVDEIIEGIDPRSMDRQRLHSAVNTALVADVKRLVSLSPEERKKAVDYIFRIQLNIEMMKK